MNSILGIVLHFQRRNDEAADQLLRTLDLEPGYHHAHWILSIVYHAMSRHADAEREVRAALSISDEEMPTKGLLGWVLGAMGRREEADAVLEELQDLSKRRYVPATSFSQACVGVGDHDRAVEWLERAYQDREAPLVWLDIMPGWDLLRPDPRFQDLVRRVGLAPTSPR